MDGTAAAEVIRLPAEERHRLELDALEQADRYPRPPGWRLSPRMVETFVVGSRDEYRASDGTRLRISPKYLGDRSLVQVAIATLASDRALLLVGEPGTAKCVKHDTLVVDPRTGERITIEEACCRRNVSVASLGDDFRLHPQQPVGYLDNGSRACYRVTTALGRKIEVTLNHPFLTIDGWQPLAQLGVGSRIALPRTMPYFGNGQMSDARARLLAHLIAEGCLTQNVPHYCNKNPELQRDFTAAVSEAFPDLQARWHPDGRSCSVSGGKRGPKAHNPCTKWLRDLGLMGSGSGEKFIPDVVFTLPRRQVALFLNRLFSGDGFLHLRESTGQVVIDYSSKSQRLIRDVQHLLLRFGINAAIKHLNSGHYRLFIQGAGPCRLFLKEIGLLGRANVEAALESLEQVARVENPNRDTVPSQVWTGVERAAAAAGYRSTAVLVKADRGVTYKGGGPRHTQSVSRARLLRLARLTDDAALATLAQSDIYWDTITSVECVGEHRVYDLSMAGTPNFVANDIVVHNSWLSEHLAAAVSGTSRYVVQGTAGTTEDQVKYSWNYALLLAEGPSERALVPSPIYRTMVEGRLVRFEELTRCASEIQDTMISILSEKELAVPELGRIVSARRGFNVIATANTRDRGINDMSSALRRRFNFVTLPVVGDLETEMTIVRKRAGELMADYRIEAEVPDDLVRVLVTTFQELRQGWTLDGQTKVKSPSAPLSTAEAISVLFNGSILATSFGSGKLGAEDLARSLAGVVSREDSKDAACLVEYLETVARGRGGAWSRLYEARRFVAAR